VATDRPALESRPCNLCGSRATRAYAVKFGLPLVSCRRCGLVYAEPRLTEADILKRYSADYLYGDYLPVFHADRNGFDLDLVAGHYLLYLKLAGRVFAPGARLLDVGCGAGLFLKAAETWGWDVEGVEISPAAAEYAGTVLGLRIRNAKLEEADLPEASFDVVTLLDTLEHLGDPLGTLAEARRILRPGGWLILNTPDLRSASRLILGNAWAVLTPPEHLYGFTEGTLRRMLGRAGFEAVAVRNRLTFNPDFTNDPSSLRRRLWKRLLGLAAAKKLLENASWMEYTDLLTLGPGRPDADALGSAPAVPASGRRAVRRLRRLVRGDTLVAVAAKP
jgi:SAM-dependent methyltransferase